MDTQIAGSVLEIYDPGWEMLSGLSNCCASVRPPIQNPHKSWAHLCNAHASSSVRWEETGESEKLVAGWRTLVSFKRPCLKPGRRQAGPDT